MKANLIILSMLFLLLTTAAQAQQATKNSTEIDIAFENASLSEVVFAISEFTGAGFVWPTSTITINWSQKGIHKLHLVPVFTEVLSSHGLTCVAMKFRKNFYSIKESSEVSGGTDTNGIYFFKHLQVGDLDKSLSGLYGGRLSYILTEGNNSIFFTGSASIVTSTAELLEKLDQPAQNLIVATQKLQHIPVKEAYEAISKMKAEVDLLPDYWSSSIIVRGPPQTVADIRRALTAMDTPHEGNIEKVAFIAALSADEVVPVLSATYPTITVTKVTAHKLLLSGPAGQVDPALDLLTRLDGSNFQVRVEAIIASLTDSEFHELGVKINSAGEAYSVTVNDDLDSLLLNNTGLLVDYFSTLLNLDFTAQDGSAHGKIISSPVLTVLNGQTARLHVGQNVPFIVREITEDDADNAGVEIERHDVGVKFEITPAVDPDGQFIHLSVSQEISSVQSERTDQAADIITDKKELATTVVLADGETIFLGGLKSEEISDDLDKIPFLSELPLIGAVFAYRSDTQVTRHLVIGLKVNVIKRS